MVRFDHSILKILLGATATVTLDTPVFCTGFAYAPNFITKIIAESTGKEPVGLLEIPAKEKTDDSAAAEEVDEEKDAPILLEGAVITRFPPEPNGYLHLGHAKAVSFNFAVAKMFQGDCHMRLDDTNPSKENQEYIDSILEDVRWIQSGADPLSNSGINKEDVEKIYRGPWVGKVHKTSDSFELIYDCAKELVKSGDAYVESLSAEEMREYRGSLTEPGKDSPYRNRSVEENLEMLEKVSISFLAIRGVDRSMV